MKITWPNYLMQELSRQHRELQDQVEHLTWSKELTKLT